MRQSTWRLALPALITEIDVPNRNTSLPGSGVRGQCFGSRASVVRTPEATGDWKRGSRSRAMEREEWRDAVPGL